MKSFIPLPVAEELSASADRFGDDPAVHAVRLMANYFYIELAEIEDQAPIVYHSRRACLDLNLPDEVFEALKDEAEEFDKSAAAYAAVILKDMLGFRDEERYDDFFSNYFNSPEEVEAFIDDWND